MKGGKKRLIALQSEVNAVSKLTETRFVPTNLGTSAKRLLVLSQLNLNLS